MLISTVPRVRPATMIRPTTRVTSSIGVNPFYIIKRRIGLKPNYILRDRIIVSNPSSFNDNGRFFPFSIVNLGDRSLGCGKRPACLRIKSGGIFHRGTAVGQTASVNNTAQVKGGGLFLISYRTKRSYRVNGRIVFSKFTATTNRIAIKSCTVLTKYYTMRRFIDVKRRTVIKTVTHIDRSILPCAVIRNRPTMAHSIGSVNVREHNFSRRSLGTIHVYCGGLFIGGGLAIRRTLRRLQRSKCTRGTYLEEVVRFIRASRQKFYR